MNLSEICIRRPVMTWLLSIAALIAGLAWRGIRGYPMTDDH